MLRFMGSQSQTRLSDLSELKPCKYSEPNSTCFKVVLESSTEETAFLPAQLRSSGNES